MEKVSPLVSRKGLRTPGQAENLASRLPYEEDAEVAAAPSRSASRARGAIEPAANWRMRAISLE